MEENAALGAAIQAAWCVKAAALRSIQDLTTAIVLPDEATRYFPDEGRHAFYREQFTETARQRGG